MLPPANIVNIQIVTFYPKTPTSNLSCSNRVENWMRLDQARKVILDHELDVGHWAIVERGPGPGNVMTHIWPQDSSYNSSVIHVLFLTQRTYLTDTFTFPLILYIKESKLLEMTKRIRLGNLILNTFGILLNLIQQLLLN